METEVKFCKTYSKKEGRKMWVQVNKESWNIWSLKHKDVGTDIEDALVHSFELGWRLAQSQLSKMSQRLRDNMNMERKFEEKKNEQAN